MRISWPLGTGIKSQHYSETVLKANGRNQDLCRHPGLSFPHENPFPEVWCLVKHLLQLWLEAVKQQPERKLFGSGSPLRLLLSLACQRLKCFPQLAWGSQSQDALLLCSSCLLEVFITHSVPCFPGQERWPHIPAFMKDAAQMFHLPVLCRTSRRKSNWQPRTARISRPTRSCWPHGIPGLTGSCWASRVLWPILLRWLRHGRWVVRSRDSCRLQRWGGIS